MKEVTVFGQQSPIRGMKSDLGAEFIGPDFAQLVENLRLRNGYAQARNGYGSALIADINASASYKGHFTCTIGTTAYLFVAVRFSSLTRVYRTTSPFSAWTEVTDSSTRFATDGNIGFAAISVNRTVTSTDKQCIIFGNGVDNNRIADIAGGTVAVINDPSYPLISYQAPVPKYVHWFAASSGKVEAITDSGKFNIANTSGIVNNFSTTGAAFTLSTTSTGVQTVTLLFDQQKSYDITPPNVSTAAAVGGLVIQKEVGMLWTNRRSGTSSSLFTGGLNNTGVNVVDYLNKIEVLALADGATDKTITGAANNGAGLIRITTSAAHGYSTGDIIQESAIGGCVEANGTWEITVITATTYDLNLSTFTNAYTSGGSARKLAYYTLWSGAEDGPPLEKTVRRGDTNSEDGIIYYYPSGTLEGLTYFCGYRFTGAIPPSTITNNLLGSFSAGSVDSQSLYAVSFGQTTSFAEGYAVPCEKRTRNFLSGPLGFQGLLYSFDPPNGVHTAYWIYSDGISSTGVRNSLFYYRADPETTNDGVTFLGQFYYLGNGGSQALSASLISGTLNIKDDDTLSASLLTSRVAYDETHIQPPAGNVMTYVNDRLYISGVATGAGTESQLWVSADRDPLDFARVVRSDDFGNLVSRSPTFRTFAGERVTGMSVLNTDILGVDTLLLWTDRRLYRLGGFSAIELSRASILGDKGCLFPNTITTYNNSAFFLDNEGQVRVTNGASISDPISYRNVSSELANGTVAQATAFAGFQRYEIFYRSANTGTGNDKGLLYDSDLGAWVRDGYAIDIRGAVAVDASPRRRMFVITEKGSLYEWDKDGVTTDAGSNIATTFTTRILATNWDRISFGRAGIVCDDVNSGTMATTRSFRGQNLPTGANSPGAVGSASLDSTTTTAWKYDTLSGGTGVPGATGYGGFVSFTATVPGGWKWYEANIQISGTGVKGASV